MTLTRRALTQREIATYIVEVVRDPAEETTYDEVVDFVEEVLEAIHTLGRVEDGMFGMKVPPVREEDP